MGRRPGREGRKIGIQKVAIAVRNGAIEVWENGRCLYDSNRKVVEFDSAYLYLQMSSHSNYPPREVYFFTGSIFFTYSSHSFWSSSMDVSPKPAV